MKREDASKKLYAIASDAHRAQVEYGHPLDGPYYAIADAAEGLVDGLDVALGPHFNFTRQDIVILRGMISARSYEKTPYHEAIVPVLQEALDVLEALTSAK